MVQWGVEDVGMWVEQCLQLPYKTSFVAAGVDGSTLLDLKEEQLASLGVTESSHLLRLLSHIAVFRSQLGRTLLVPDIALEPISLSEVPYKGGSAQPSAVLRDREKGNRQKAPQDQQRPRLLRRARSAPGVEPNSLSKREGSKIEKNTGRVLQTSRPKSSARPSNTEFRRARSQEIVGRQGVARPCPKSVPLQIARGQQAPAQEQPAKKQAASVAARKQETPAVVANDTSMGEASSQLIVPSALAGSENQLGLVIPGACENPHYDARGEGVRDEVLLSGRTRSPEQSPRQSSSRGSISQSSPRARLNESSFGCHNSVISNTSIVHSEFGRDYRRGASFPIADRCLLSPVLKLKGPELYDSGVSALRTSGVSKTGQAERRTMEGMLLCGGSSPGTGKYNPHDQNRIRGGSMGSARRFRRSLVEKSPGPESYSPRHSYKSNFK